MIVHTENLFSESMSHRLMFDKTVAVKQLHVVEAHGILLFRADKGTGFNPLCLNNTDICAFSLWSI
jgi:hypothetical protein